MALSRCLQWVNPAKTGIGADCLLTTVITYQCKIIVGKGKKIGEAGTAPPHHLVLICSYHTNTKNKVVLR